jgi:hypothetical protein
MTRERRRNPRIQIYGKLHGQLVALDVPVTVTEISLSGLRFETGIDFPAGAVHEFRLTLGDESAVFIKGSVVHCRRISAAGEPARFIVGVRFIDDEGADAHSISGLVDRVS